MTEGCVHDERQWFLHEARAGRSEGERFLIMLLSSSFLLVLPVSSVLMNKIILSFCYLLLFSDTGTTNAETQVELHWLTWLGLGDRTNCVIYWKLI